MGNYREQLENWIKEQKERYKKNIANYKFCDEWDKARTEYMILGAVLFSFRMGYITEEEMDELIERYTK